MYIPDAVASPHPAQLQLDAPGSIFIPGQPLTGRVTLTGAQPDSGELLVEVHAFTVGHDGHPGYAVLASQSLYNGPFHPGASITFLFQVATPRCISRYQGQLFNLETRLAVVTLLSSQGPYRPGVRREPAAWLPIAIAHDARPLSITPISAPDFTGTPGGFLGGCAGFGCATLGSIGLGTVVLLGLLNGFGDNVVSLTIAGVIALCFLVLGISYVYGWLRDTAIYRRIGVPSLSVGPGADGQSVVVELQLGRFKSITGANATIRAGERTETLLFVRHDGLQEFRHAAHELARVPVELTVQPDAQKLCGLVPLAALANLPPNVGNGHAKIVWHLELHVQLKGCPDFRHTFPIDVGPGGQPFPVPTICS
jgi:hypothetical protein